MTTAGLAADKEQQRRLDSLSDKQSDNDNFEKPAVGDAVADLEGQQTSPSPSPPAETDEKKSPSAGPPPGDAVPNGGTRAWLQVLGAWMLFFNTWGILNTFGVFQTYYESEELFVESSSNISWIGSIQAFMVLLVGLFAGPIYDRGYFRHLLLVGSFLIVFGFMMLSLCNDYWQCLLAQGFVIGIGGGCLFVPSVAIMPTYFSTKIGLVIGLAASGSSVGGIIYPIMFYRLVDEVGFGWSVRILGFTALATLLIPISVMRMRVKPPKPRSVVDWSAFTDVPYMTFIFGALIGFIGLYVGFFYISFYGQATGYTNASLSFYLVPILNAGSVFGRTLPNILADKIGPANVIAPGAVMVGIVLLCMLAVHNAAGLVVVAVFYGFFSGIFIALPPVMFVALTKDKSKVGTRIGMGFALIGLGVLAGGPGGGGILGTGAGEVGGNLHWTGTWVYAGICTIAGGCIFCIVRVMVGGTKLMKRV